MDGCNPRSCGVETEGDQELSYLCVQNKFKVSLDHVRMFQESERKKAKRIRIIREAVFILCQVTLLEGGCGKQALRHTLGHKLTAEQAVCGHPPCFSCLGAKAWLSCCQSAEGRPFWPLWFILGQEGSRKKDLLTCSLDKGAAC